ncbi:HPr family phosphocarrier protein [Hypericibacter adhaerens]|jgi:phosphocarrier protein|nr:HPr family phosphocarrier protein [Hypericibacter adhaerens]
MSAGDMPGSGPLTAHLEIRNQRGLHARAAAKFVQALNGFQADIVVIRGDMEVSGRSIMGLMMLAAGPGSVIEVRATGTDAAAALGALEALIGRKFDES